MHSQEGMDDSHDICIVLAGVMPQMTALTCLELGAGGAGGRYREYPPLLQRRYACALVRVVEALMRLKHIAALLVSIYVAAGRFIVPLLAASAKVDLSVELYGVLFDVDFELEAVQRMVDAVGAYAPLFPFLTELVVDVVSMQQVQPISLQPLLEHATALRRLRGLKVRTDPTHMSSIAGLFSAVPTLTSLTWLNLGMTIDDQNADNRAEVLPGVRALVRGLPGMHQLRQMGLVVHTLVPEDMKLDLLRACTGLTALETLDLHGLTTPLSAEVLSRLRVKDFSVRMRVADPGVVAGQVKLLRDLRVLRITGLDPLGLLPDPDVTPVREAVEDLPAFHTLWM